MTDTTREALQNLIDAIEYTPLGVRAIVALGDAKRVLAADNAVQDGEQERRIAELVENRVQLAIEAYKDTWVQNQAQIKQLESQLSTALGVQAEAKSAKPARASLGANGR